jgi:integrating conjugative element protein (TIGR03759 family)
MVIVAKMLLATTLLWPGLGLALQASRSSSVPSQVSKAQSTPLDLQSTEVGASALMPLQSRYSREPWGLTEPEWTRYLQLMKGIRGSVSQGNISPLEVLGIHAETEKERRDYARRFARMMKEDTERVLAFSKAYADEAAQLNAGLPIIDKALMQLVAGVANPDKAILPGDRLLLFTRTQSCGECERLLATAVELSSQAHAQLDIYFHDATTDQEIRQWVDQHAIDPDRIKAGTITFNHHRGELSQLAGVTATVPKLMRLRGSTAVQINPN